MEIFKGLHAFLWRSTSANNCNAYFIDGPGNILIDPGHQQFFNHVSDGLGDLDIEPRDVELVLCTHPHPDHLEAVQLFKTLPAMFAMHPEGWEFVKSMQPHMGIDLESFTPDFLIKEGSLEIKGLEFQIFHTPGHAPGSICIYWPGKRVLITGDLIFKEGLGRTDLPGGDSGLLKESIRRLRDLDVEYILPGHGDVVSGVSAVRANFDHLERVWFPML
jgi:hydroxyacylglutathione hydrolase